MKVIKLPSEYVRYILEGKHVVFGHWEYWKFMEISTRGIHYLGCTRKDLNDGHEEEVKVVC